MVTNQLLTLKWLPGSRSMEMACDFICCILGTSREDVSGLKTLSCDTLTLLATGNGFIPLGYQSTTHLEMVARQSLHGDGMWLHLLHTRYFSRRRLGIEDAVMWHAHAARNRKLRFGPRNIHNKSHENEAQTSVVDVLGNRFFLLIIETY